MAYPSPLFRWSAWKLVFGRITSNAPWKLNYRPFHTCPSQNFSIIPIFDPCLNALAKTWFRPLFTKSSIITSSCEVDRIKSCFAHRSFRLVLARRDRLLSRAMQTFALYDRNLPKLSLACLHMVFDRDMVWKLGKLQSDYQIKWAAVHVEPSTTANLDNGVLQIK